MDKKEKVVLFWSVVLICIGGWFFMHTDMDDSNRVSGESIGVINEIEKSVKRKSSEGLSWGHIEDGAEIYSQDQILTYDKSSAQIVFKDGTKIKVAENSLLRITFEKGGVDVGLLKGFASLDLKDKRDPNSKLSMTIGTEKLDIGASNAKLDISSEGGRARLFLVEGRAEISKSGDVMSMNRGEEIVAKDGQSLTEARISKAVITLSFPENQSSLFFKDKSLVNFQYSSSDNLESVNLILAESLDFKNAKSYSLTGRNLEISDLLPRKYFWKVVGKLENSTVESLVYNFDLLPEKPVDLFFPPHYAEFRIDGLPSKMIESIQLKWEQVKGTKKYVVAIGTLKEESEVIEWKEIETESNNYLLSQMPVNKYFWKVKVRDAFRPSATWSEIRNFIVSSDAAIRAIYPLENDLVVLNTTKAIAQEFKYLGDEKKEYLFDLYKDKEGGPDELIIRSREKGLVIAKKPLVLGPQKYNVRSSITTGNQTGFISFVQTAIFTENLTPIHGEKIELIRPRQPLVLSWKYVSLSTLSYLVKTKKVSFEVEISNDEDFENILWRRVVDGTQTIWNPENEGLYYFRVKARFDHRDTQFVLPSETTSFTLALPNAPDDIPEINLRDYFEMKTEKN